MNDIKLKTYNTNRRNLLRFVFIFFLMLPTLIGYSQSKLLGIADKQYDEQQYINAQQSYQKLIKVGNSSANTYKKLGDSYYFNRQLESAYQWYEELINKYPTEVTPEYYFRYAQCLRSLGMYDKADQLLANYAMISEKRAFDINDDYLEKIEYQSGRYAINKLKINSPFTDFGSAKYGDTLIFSSSRDTLLLNKRIHKWTGESFLSLYQVIPNRDSITKSSVKLFAPEINTKFHESTPVFTKDGMTMYFTKNTGKVNKKELDILGIYKAEKKPDGSWSEPVEFLVQKQVSYAHPALSTDEGILYFSSDLPGGYGDSDLYGVYIQNGEPLTPFNLGPLINTLGKETFPSVTNEGGFYFSSDGHPGIGGLDVFYFDFAKNEPPINIGRPINDKNDDFAFILDEITKEGFFTSNRPGGEGGDDIYSFSEINRIRSFDLNVIVGSVLDKGSKAPLEEAIVSVYDTKQNRIDQVIVSYNGEFNFESEALKNAYSIKVERPGYASYEHIIDRDKYQDVYYKTIELESNVKSDKSLMTEFNTLTTKFVFELIVDPIHFVDQTDELEEKAISKINEIIVLIQKYPELKVNIKSYINENNLIDELADNRALKVWEYLIQNNVDSSRLRAVGVQKGSVKIEEKLQLVMVIPMPINFNLNSDELRNDSKTSLNEVVELLSMYDTMKMEVHGHADSRSSFWYNKRLSVKRMRAAMNYIIDKGNIYWRRLRGRAYGERKLYNNCADGVPCTEEEHEKNRRCEFILKE